MAEIKAHEFASLTRGGRVSYPIALIFGPDRGLVAERGAEIAKNSGVDLKDDFSVVRMDASELSGDPGRLLDEVLPERRSSAIRRGSRGTSQKGRGQK